MQPAVRGGFRLQQDEYRRNPCKYGILSDLARLRKHRDGTMAELSLRMVDIGANLRVCCLPMAAAGWTRRPGLRL
jgi:hypothetical protein